MKVVVAHNFYQQPGGEDQSFAAEVAALRTDGFDVTEYTVHNDAVAQIGRLRTAAKTVWNHDGFRDCRALLRRVRPDIVHLQNTFPLISPSASYAAKQEGIPVVQSLRNYRLLCPNGLFFRDGAVCEECLNRSVPWPAVRHKCYRGSAAGSAVVAAMLTIHRGAGTWSGNGGGPVDQFIALTEFSRRKLIEGGLPADRIAVKPNFVTPDPGPGAGAGGYAMFVGRLSEEKGLHTLLKAWETLGPRVPLKIVGDGPLAPLVRAAAERSPHVQWLGRRPAHEVYDIAGDARFLVLPSEWYETFGRVAVEAFAKGTPVLASRLGAMTELVDDGRTGYLFTPGDADDLAAKVDLMLSQSPLRAAEMRRAARLEFEAKYTAARNVQMMREIYERVLARRRSGAVPVPERPALAIAGQSQ
ncbi:MAG: glycosyltransferase [Tepidisphaeraceae bacterium]